MAEREPNLQAAWNQRPTELHLIQVPSTNTREWHSGYGLHPDFDEVSEMSKLRMKRLFKRLEHLVYDTTRSTEEKEQHLLFLSSFVNTTILDKVREQVYSAPPASYQRHCLEVEQRYWNKMHSLIDILQVGAQRDIIAQRVKLHRQRKLAMAMAFHPRLGAHSPMRVLPRDLFTRHILQYDT